MGMLSNRVAAFALLTLIASQLSAEEITYAFAGTVQDGNIIAPGPPLPLIAPIGTPVTGTVTYELSAPGEPFSTGPDGILGVLYTSPAPAARMTLHVRDTVIETSNAEDVQIAVGNGIPSSLIETNVDAIIFASRPSQPAPVGLVLVLEDTTGAVLSSPALPAWIPLERFDLRRLQVQYPTGEMFLSITVHTLDPVARVSAVDILPGKFPNIVRLDAQGDHFIEVALLAARERIPRLDLRTVRFGPSGVEAAPIRSTSKDVDSDGRKDLVFLFRRDDTAIDCATTSATLTATTMRGGLVRGADATVPRPCS